MASGHALIELGFEEEVRVQNQTYADARRAAGPGSSPERRDAAMDLLRDCAMTLQAVRSRTRDGHQSSDNFNLAAQERAWLTGNAEGIMPIQECVAAICGGQQEGPDVSRVVEQVRRAVLTDPGSVIQAIDTSRGNALDHFQMYGARALQAEMLADSLLYVRNMVNRVRADKPISHAERVELLVEVRWLTGQDTGAISAGHCLEAVLGISAEEAAVAQSRIACMLPTSFVTARLERDLEGITANQVAIADVPQLEDWARLFVLAGEGQGVSAVEWGDALLGASHVAEHRPRRDA